MEEANSNGEEAKKFAEETRAFGRKVEAELEPFMNIIRCIPREYSELEMFRQAYFDYLRKHEHYGKISRYLAHDTLKITGTHKDKLQWILWYLGVLEGINHTVVNILVILLNASKTKTKIANPGNNYYLKRISQANSLEDLEEKFIPLNAKLIFLRANGLKEVASVIDAEFRNDVAHFNFDVQNNEIVVGGKNIMPLIATNIHKLLRLLFVTNDLLSWLSRESFLRKDMLMTGIESYKRDLFQFTHHSQHNKQIAKHP